MEQTNIIKLLADKVKDYKGYTLLELLPGGDECNIIHYDTKEEFYNEFSFDESKYFPHGKKLLPLNIIAKHGREAISCTIQGEEHYLNMMELYLVIDGEIYDSLEELKNK